MHRVIVCALLLALVATPASGEVTFKRGMLTIVQGAVRVKIQVEVADTAEARAQGLMHRPRLDELAGMLFVFDETGTWGFWMKNTLIPLSIAFIDDHWKIVDIKDMQVVPDPERGPFPIYAPARPYRYALEVNQGFFKRHSLGVGAKITYSVSTPRTPYVPHKP